MLVIYIFFCPSGTFISAQEAKKKNSCQCRHIFVETLSTFWRHVNWEKALNTSLVAKSVGRFRINELRPVEHRRELPPWRGILLRSAPPEIEAPLRGLRRT
jgi:hypothetical protein